MRCVKLRLVICWQGAYIIWIGTWNEDLDWMEAMPWAVSESRKQDRLVGGLPLKVTQNRNKSLYNSKCLFLSQVMVWPCLPSRYAAKQRTVDGSCRRGRPRKSRRDNSKEWTSQTLSLLLRIADDRSRWITIAAEASVLGVTGVSWFGEK